MGTCVKIKSFRHNKKEFKQTNNTSTLLQQFVLKELHTN